MTALYKYTYQHSALNTAISEWSFTAYQMCNTNVLPDGCRDLIVKTNPQAASAWFVSELSRSAYSVSATPGMRIRGVRLKPGVTVRKAQLTSWLLGRNPEELLQPDQLDEFCTSSYNLSAALDCLASGERTALSVAKNLGVSLRTLERLVKSGTGESPYFWISLARVRKAARSLNETGNLSEMAFEAGYSDQAHMNREMKKWFQQTPLQIKKNDELQSTLAEPGYG